MGDDATEGIDDAAGGDDEGNSGDAGDSFDPAVPGADADSDVAADSDDDAYSGVFGAFPYALRESESLLFRSYAVLGGLLALGITLLFGLSVVVLLGATAAAAGGSFTFSRAFFVFVGLLVVAPLLAPVLFVARRRRRGSANGRYDARLAALGYLFVASLYVALVISTPAEQQEAVTGSYAPLVRFLYDLPRLAGLAPPSVVAALIWLAGRRWE